MSPLSWISTIDENPGASSNDGTSTNIEQSGSRRDFGQWQRTCISRRTQIMQTFTKMGLDALLTPENWLLLLIDHQPFQLGNVNSHDFRTRPFEGLF
jgi:hypothetical protein